MKKSELAKEHARYARQQGRIDPLYLRAHVWHLDLKDRELAQRVRKELKMNIPLHPKLEVKNDC